MEPVYGPYAPIYGAMGAGLGILQLKGDRVIARGEFVGTDSDVSPSTIVDPQTGLSETTRAAGVSELSLDQLRNVVRNAKPVPDTAVPTPEQLDRSERQWVTAVDSICGRSTPELGDLSGRLDASIIAMLELSAADQAALVEVAAAWQAVAPPLSTSGRLGILVLPLLTQLDVATREMSGEHTKAEYTTAAIRARAALHGLATTLDEVGATHC
jgi:hypothetical protein